MNNNIRLPNQKRAIYQVVVAGEGEEKEWENKAKGEVLKQMYDDNSGRRYPRGVAIPGPTR